MRATEEDLRCNYLLFFSTSSEEKQLKAAARAIGQQFHKCNDERIGEFYNLGVIGGNRVNAVKTEMGPFFNQGSAAQAIICRTITSATSIIQLGMAFGVDRDVQKPGDVLVSQWIFPYDYRTILEKDGRYQVDYSRTQKYHAKRSLLALFEREQKSPSHPFKVYIGGMLSGGARIFSKVFLKELITASVGGGLGEYVGGEMEGVGLLSACDAKNPEWIVVKGISDFADADRHGEIENTRALACRNAADFVLSALRRLGDPVV